MPILDNPNYGSGSRESIMPLTLREISGKSNDYGTLL
jgi:hypothetical protein